MIKIFNANKVTSQPFFQELIAYLQSHDDVTLRMIKAVFPDQPKIDRAIEEYVQAGYIARQDKRYSLTLPLLEKAEQISLDDQIFVDSDSAVYADLLALNFETQLANASNQALLVEKTSISRNELTFANYLHKMKSREPLSEAQLPLYQLLGDVNQDYALKYMTTFLLKFARRQEIPQKRPDIFVSALEVLGYIRKNENDRYELTMDFDMDQLVFRAK